MEISEILLLGAFGYGIYYFFINKGDTAPVTSSTLPTIPTATTNTIYKNVKTSSGSFANRNTELLKLGKVEQTYWADKKGVGYANTWTDNFNAINAALASKRVK